MLVADVMTRSLALVDADATVREAARAMRDQHVGFLPVTLQHTCVGVLTDRDVVTRVVAAGLDPDETRVALVMSRGVADASPHDLGANEAIASISQEDTVDEAARMMERLGVHRLAVHDADFTIVGIVSRGDLAAVPAAVE